MPTIVAELPEQPRSNQPVSPTPEMAAETPGGRAHVEFSGTLYGSPPPDFDPFTHLLEPWSEIDYDWVRVPVRAGDHVIAELTQSGSPSFSVYTPAVGGQSALGDDLNPAGNIYEFIAPVDTDFFYAGVNGTFARADIPYKIDNTTAYHSRCLAAATYH